MAGDCIVWVTTSPFKDNSGCDYIFEVSDDGKLEIRNLTTLQRITGK